MWTRIFSYLRGSLGGSSLPSQSEEGREFFQARMMLLSKIGCIILFAALGSRVLADYLLNGWRFFDQSGKAVYLSELGAGIVVLVAWQLVARRRLSARAMGLLDLFITVTLCFMFSFGVWLAEPLRTLPDKALLVAVNLLVFRSIILPCTAAWTLFLGVLGSIPVVVFGGLTLRRWPAGFPGYNPAFETAMLGQWMLIGVVISTVTSAVIYRLRRTVQQAQRLGQYTLEEKLGEGGMGVVYRARHALLRRPTAVKLLRPGSIGDASISRFEREVQITSGLTHPNTIAIYDYGRTPDGIFYYAMEYLEGLDLERLVHDHGPVPPARAIHIIRQLVSSLAEAHAVGLIHRDIKPANVILCERGGVFDVAKVLDFGLVKVLTGGDAALSSPDMLAGTPQYMPPEAFQDPETVDARSDVYAVGAVAYYLVTGQRVFDGANVYAVMSQQLTAKPPPPSERLGRALPKDLEALILRCLEKDPDQRAQTAGELLALLESLADAGQWRQQDAEAWWRDRQARREGAAARPAIAERPTSQSSPTITITVEGR